MAAPTFTLPVSGSDPKLATKKGLEDKINAALRANYDSLMVNRQTLEAEIVARTGADADLVAALAAAGNLYLTPEDGIAATSDGDVFLVYKAGAVEVYLNDSGSADLQGSFTPSRALAAIGWRPRPSEPPHSQNKVRVSGVWYSPDPVFGLGIGQSNEKANAAATDGDKTGSGDVWVWNGTAFVEAVLGVAPFTTGTGVPNNKLFHAAHRYSVEKRVPVYFFLEAVPGSGIGTWLLEDPDVYPEEWDAATPGTNWLDMHAQVEAGLASADVSLYPADVRKIAFVSWAQGEDEYDLTPLYTLSTVRYPQLAYQVKTAAWAAQGIRLVMTELLRQSAGGTAYRANEEIRKFVASGLFPNVYMLSTAQSVPTGADVGQIVHFSGASQQRQGYELADILMGRNIGVTSDGVARAIDATGQMLWKERACSWVIELQIDASDTFPQTLTMQPAVDGLPVVFEVDGVFTEVVSASGAAVLEHDAAAASTVRIWYPTDAMRDQPPGFACTAAAGEGTIRSVRFNPLADLSSLYLANQPIKGRLVAAALPRSLATLRIQDAPGVIWTDFVPADLPPALTLLNFNDSLVPNHVQAAITAENTARGEAITVQSLGIAAGFGAADVFTSVTEMTAAITNGFARPDGWVAIISNAAAGTLAILQAKAGEPAVPAVSPAGWSQVDAIIGAATPLNFGAVGDGVADDTVAVLAWAAYVNALPLAIARVPDGYHFRTSEEIVWTRPVHLYGSGTIEQTTWGRFGMRWLGDGSSCTDVRVISTQTRTALSSDFADRFEGGLARIRSAAHYVTADYVRFRSITAGGFVSDVRFEGRVLYETGQDLGDGRTVTINTVELPASFQQADDHYNGTVLDLQNVTGHDGTPREIVDYDGSTNVATVSPDFTGVPAGADAAYRIRLARQKGCAIHGLRGEGEADFRIAVAWVDGLDISHVDVDDIVNTQGDTPHTIYAFGGADVLRSRGITGSNLYTRNSLVGLAYKFRGVDGLALTNLIADRARGVLHLGQCRDAHARGLVCRELGAGYGGSCWGARINGGVDVSVRDVTCDVASDYSGSDVNAVEISGSGEAGPYQVLTDYIVENAVLRSDIGTANNGALTAQAVRIEATGALSPSTQRGKVVSAKAIETSGDGMTVRAVYAEAEAYDLDIIDPYAEGTEGTIQPVRVNGTCQNVLVVWDPSNQPDNLNLSGTNVRAYSKKLQDAIADVSTGGSATAADNAAAINAILAAMRAEGRIAS